MKPVLLDLFGCEGGASHGYVLAGFEVWTVDNAPARHRRNPYAWHLGDWADGLERALATGQVQAIHASPPCHVNSRATVAVDRSDYPDLIEPVRDALEATGLPYVIENVEGALPKMRQPLRLCGSEFGLRSQDTDGTWLWLKRHRLFESNIWLWPADGCQHPTDLRCAGVYSGARRDEAEARLVRRGGYVPKDVEVLRALLGAPDWMTEAGLFLSIPPAFSRFIGEQMMAAVSDEMAA